MLQLLHTPGGIWYIGWVLIAHLFMHTNDLIARLSRVEGQIQALKRSLASGAAEADCTKTLYQVKAANNALKRFGEAFTRAYATQCLATEGANNKRLARRIDDIVSSAFSLS